MRWIPAILLTLAATSAAAEVPVRRALENLSRGLRFEIKLTAIAQAPSDPQVIYVGSQHGRVHVSRDGGQSWQESTALTRRGAFYGAIRKQNTGHRRQTVGIATPRGPGNMLGLSTRADSNTGEGSTNFDAIELGGYRPVEFGQLRAALGVGLRGRRKLGTSGMLRRMYDGMFLPGRSLSRGGGGGAGSDLAVGIKSGAPRLAFQVRRKRKWGIGINLQQTLALKAAPATGMWFFDVDPKNPNDVLAATADGLRRSRDGGDSWPLVLTGPTPRERAINHLARRPDDPRVIYAGTGRGLQISRDGGESWEPAGHPFVVASDIRWVDFDRTRPDVFYVGATWGLLRTKDGGRSFGLAFRSSWPRLSLVRQVQIDPHDPRRIWLATADGLLLSEDDGASFERVGGLLFVGTNVKCLSPGPAPGHMIAVTDTEIWETRDGGENWQIALFGRVQWKISYGMFELGRPESILVLTEAEVLRFGPVDRAEAIPEVLLERYRRRIASEPSQGQAVRRALEQAGVYRPTLVATRARARWSSLLPKVNLVGGFRDLDTGVRKDRILETVNPVPELNVAGTGLDGGFAWRVWASWDLSGLLFARAEAPIARVGRTNRYAEWSIRSTVINAYQERRRLIYESMTDGRPDPRVGLMRGLRIDELTAQLDMMTGGLFAGPDRTTPEDP